MFFFAHVAGIEGLHRVGLELVIAANGFVQVDKLHWLGFNLMWIKINLRIRKR
jgi:hypothetical protein